MFGSGSDSITSRINVVQGDTSGLRVFERAQNEAEELRREFLASEKAAKKLADQVENVGKKVDFGRTGGALERVVGGLGADNALLGVAGDAADLIESLAAEPGGLKGALKSLLSPASLLSGALALGGVAMAAFTAEIERQRAAAAQAAQELAASAQSQESYRQLLEKSGTAAIENAKREQQAQFEIEAAAVTALDTRRKELQLIVDAQRARGTFLTQEQADLDALNAEYDKHAQALYGVNQNILILNDIMSGTEFAAARAAEGFDKLRDFVDTGRDAVDKFGGLITGTLETIGEMAEDTADAAAKAAEEFAKLQDSVQSAVDKLDADGVKLGDELRKSIADLNQQAVDAQLEAAEEIAELQIDAAHKRLEDEAEFNKQANRAYEDFRAEQRRIREDADRAEKSAIESNDVLSLLNIRAEAQIEKQRNRERFETERQRRAEDFADRQRAEAAALELTIAGINQRRDQELANITAEIAAERAAFDEAIARIELQKSAQIAQIEAVVAANETRYAAEEAAIDRIANKWEAMTFYYNGNLTNVPPTFGNGLVGPPKDLLGVPPPPIDPFGFGNFFNALPPPRDPGPSYTPPERSQSTPPTFVFGEGSVIVGDLASQDDIERAFGALLNQLFKQRTGAAA